MKKFRISVFLMAVLIGVNFISCNKDDFSEKDAMNLQAQLDKQKILDQDTLNTKNYRVSYAVNIVDASTSTLKSASVVSAITGAKVKFVQDTTIITKTADASGIVAFSNLKPGVANINITLADYSEVNYTVDLSSSSINGGRQFSNIIPLIPIAGTATGVIKGKVICETDLTNKAPETAPTGTKIIALINTATSDALASISGNITSISYDKLSLTAITDANGDFSMTVPATILGLSYDIKVSDFTVDQKLLLNKYLSKDTFGLFTIPTNFGSSFTTNASKVIPGDSAIVTISAPDYSFTDADAATATAVFDNSFGINNIQITNNGGNYSSPSTAYKVTIPGSSNKATGTLTLTNGRVSGISVTTAGSQYAATAENSAFSIPYVYENVIATVATVSGSGIATLTIPANRRGIFYNTDTANVLETYTNKTIGIGGSGARVIFNFLWNANGYWEVNSAAVASNPTGAGYAVGDTIGLRVRSGKEAYMTGNLHLTTGSITAISVSKQGANYFSGKVDVVIGTPSVLGGTQATATAAVTNGKISAITVGTAGSGYTSAPTVTIVNKAEKVQAKFNATVSNGKVTALPMVNAGNGYLTVPTVTITPAISGAGSGASAYATISGGQVSLTLVNNGIGYRGNLPKSAKDYSGTSSTIVKGSSTTIINIDLGTGKRTIEN